MIKNNFKYSMNALNWRTRIWVSMKYMLKMKYWWSFYGLTYMYLKNSLWYEFLLTISTIIILVDSRHFKMSAGCCLRQMGRVKRIWFLLPMRAAKVQASLRIRAVSPEPPLLAPTSSETRGTFRQKSRSLAPLNGWACAVKICHDGMLEDTNSLDAVQI